MRTAIREWAKSGKPSDPLNPVCVKRKNSKKAFRSSIRREHARIHFKQRDTILSARTSDTKLFYSLVNKQRKNAKNFIDDLNVEGDTFTGNYIVNGFKTHFEQLAQGIDSEQFDANYNSQVNLEVDAIQQLVQEVPVPAVTECELDTAISKINTGKSADFYELTIEHVINAGCEFKTALLNLINSIFQSGEIPESMKIGLLSPVYKNKGSAKDSVNYRGITILPVFEKIIEVILKGRIVGTLEQSQSVFQRGFTKNTSPLHASLIIEEATRECKDKNTTCDLIFLDAKSAFDVVDHEHLLRRLFNAGVTDRHWRLIQSMHSNSVSVVKWMNSNSEPFNVYKRVKQGGVASTDFYKVYIDPLLHRLENSSFGKHIGIVNCCSSACADDVAVISTNHIETQLLINIAEDFAQRERYLLQPAKTESLEFTGKRSKATTKEWVSEFELYGKTVNKVETATHLGVRRSNSLADTSDTQIDNNIQQSRKKLYSLLSTGLHGTNGLDPATSLHLLNTYVVPTLLYGLELLVINKTQFSRLELYKKKVLKQILSVPSNTSNAAVYIISGMLPVEAAIHKKALNLYYSVCLLSENSIEKRLARRQLAVKSIQSNSWFVAIKKTLWKYSLPEAEELLNTPYTMPVWKRLVHRKVNDFWVGTVAQEAALCKSLKFLNCVYTPGKPHPLLRVPIESARSINRIPVKMKILTGTYILQSTRVAFNQNEVDPTCRLCYKEPESLEHVVLKCSDLEQFRSICFPEIDEVLRTQYKLALQNLTSRQKLEILIDCTCLIKKYENSSHKLYMKKIETLSKLENLCRQPPSHPLC